MTFEESIAKLDEVILLLESGNLPLDKSVELYKEGITLMANCKKELDEAKLKITIVEDTDDIGE